MIHSQFCKYQHILIQNSLSDHEKVLQLRAIFFYFSASYSNFVENYFIDYLYCTSIDDCVEFWLIKSVHNVIAKPAIFNYKNIRILSFFPAIYRSLRNLQFFFQSAISTVRKVKIIHVNSEMKSWKVALFDGFLILQKFAKLSMHKYSEKPCFSHF